MGEELKKLYLKTEDLYFPSEGFQNVIPAFNNTYEVLINFNTDGGFDTSLLDFINAHGLYDNSKISASDYLALFCSEAVLPGSQITSQTVDGLRQGVSQHFATFRKYPDIDLTFYTQKDYYSNEVFNAWMEYISPSLISNDRGAVINDIVPMAYKKLRYPGTYKCDILITAFANNHLKPKDRLKPPGNSGARSNTGESVDFDSIKAEVQTPSNIQYKLIKAFPVNIVAAPLAYGNSQLIKTTVTFKYEQFFINRQSRDRNNELRLKDLQTIAALNTV